MKNLESNPLIAQCLNQLRHPAPNTANSANIQSELRVIPGKGTGIFITFFFPWCMTPRHWDMRFEGSLLLRNFGN
jgi:hypothetical protein